MRKENLFVRESRLKNQSGFALVMVMTTVLILELICFFLAQTRGVQTKAAFNRIQKLKARYLAEAGLAHGLWRLENNPDWRVQMADLPLGDGSYTVSFSEDTLGRKIVIDSQSVVGGAKSSARRTVHWLVIQPPYTSDTKEADTYIKKGEPDTVFDDKSELLLDSEEGGGKRCRTLARFNFSKCSLPPDAKIVSSFFSMYLYQIPKEGFIPDIYRIHRIIQDWLPSATTWKERNKNLHLAWSAPGGAFDPSYEDSKIFTTLGWQRWRTTNLVRFWLKYPAQNYGLILETDIRAGNNEYKFRSSSYSDNPTLRPKLVIYYLDSRRP
ncbi:MAG: DNRLRE domain-containing protein [bacterium]|nr:DNRLRE domain-containing protein [bacterium]